MFSRRVPCSPRELEAARMQMFRLVARAENLERAGNALGAFALWEYVVEMAHWLCGAESLQSRVRPWRRWGAWANNRARRRGGRYTPPRLRSGMPPGVA